MEKVLVTSTGEAPDSEIDSHFGRCKFLLVCDPESGEVEKAIANKNAEAQGAAGVSTAQMVTDLGIKKVITGNVGPKAFDALNSAGIEIYIAETGSVGDSLEAFKNGKLKKIDESSASMHSGLGMRKE